ncbi:MAG: hypothetical protein R3Y22_09625 [Bacteroidales bacterium]
MEVSNFRYTPESLFPNSSSYVFDWSTNREQGLNNSYLNDIDNRRDASKKLVANLIEWNNMSNFEEVILVAHSHGGNVAIQAADELAKIFKKVTIITYGTPAMNKKYLTNKKVPQTSQYSAFTPAIIPFNKYTEQGDLNKENPENWNNKSKINHIAIYTDKDKVDNYSYILESNRSQIGMNRLTSHYKDNGVTVNLKVKPLNKSKVINELENNNSPSENKFSNNCGIRLFGNHSIDICDPDEIERVLSDYI